MKRSNIVSVLGVSSLLALVACGGGNEPAKTPSGTGPATATAKTQMTQAAQDKFDAAVDAFVSNDKNVSWTDQTCSDVTNMFMAAAAEQPSGKLPEAQYDAGLVWQRCGNDDKARGYFEKALSDEPNFHYAKAELALYDYKKTGNVDQAITSLQAAVEAASFQNVPALVNLAMFQMQRNSAQGCTQGGQPDGKDDMECAKKNLQRALAIDDGYMPAFNQLALYYFQLAKQRATASGGKGSQHNVATNAGGGRHADAQQLDLAALVCSQALRKNANYAPIHNTSGLIQNETGQVNGAVSEFATAAQLDPKFFEAQMNFAAVNLSFRGFEKAQGAYQKALVMRPNDYDAHLGLALAYRGQINDSNYDQQVASVQSELDAAKKIDGNRPDAYYNEGILTQEYKAKSGGDKNAQIAALDKAIQIYQTFISKASGKSEYDAAVKKANDRIQDCNDTKTFLTSG